jgi:hypothetical protein
VENLRGGCCRPSLGRAPCPLLRFWPPRCQTHATARAKAGAGAGAGAHRQAPARMSLALARRVVHGQWRTVVVGPMHAMVVLGQRQEVLGVRLGWRQGAVWRQGVALGVWLVVTQRQVWHLGQPTPALLLLCSWTPRGTALTTPPSALWPSFPTFWCAMEPHTHTCTHALPCTPCLAARWLHRSALSGRAVRSGITSACGAPCCVCVCCVWP